MKLPETENDLSELVSNNIPESLHLDYKASDALSDKKKDEILKDVSAFANSDGGILIYGIKEDKQTKKLSIDSGIDTSARNYREWLENIVDSGISPKISQLRINAIQLTNGNFAYALEVPKSTAAPHQSPDKKYYKRFNSKSEPMEHYEIEDIRNRSYLIQPLVDMNIELFQGIVVNIVISNQGDYTAENVKFSISESMKERWQSLNHGIPNIFQSGLSRLPPKKSYRFGYDSYMNLVDNNLTRFIFIEANYFHPLINSIKTERFEFDLEDIRYALIEESYTEKLEGILNRNFGKIERNLEKLCDKVEYIAKDIGQFTRLKNAFLGYITPTEVELNIIVYEYDCRVIDVINSIHERFSLSLFKQNLSRYIYFIDSDNNISNKLSILPEVDFVVWYRSAKNLSTKELYFKNDLERLSLLKGLFTHMLIDDIYYKEALFYFTHFKYVSNNLNDCVLEIIRLLFVPFARDIRALLT